MRFFHRLALFLLTILFLFVTFLIGMYAFGWLPQSYLLQAVNYSYGNLKIAILSLALFLSGIWLLQSFITENKNDQTIIQDNEMGQVRISSAAVKGLVDQVVLDQSGIKEVKSRFKIRGEFFKINLRLAVTSEAHIPTLSTELGKTVKERLFNMAGLHVDEVLVTVEEVDTHVKKRSGSARVR